MPIITISRQKGSLGSFIGQALRDELGYVYLDRAILEQELVSKYGLAENLFERYDEKKPRAWDFLIGGKDKYLHYLKTCIYDFARQGNCIIAGRGGQALFKDFPGVLRVSIVGPTDVRIERVKKRFNYDLRLAIKVVDASDHDRAGFHEFFYKVDWEDYRLYDLVLNTRNLAVETGVGVIKGALRGFDTAELLKDTENRLSDLCLTQHVLTEITYVHNVPAQYLEAKSDQGIVTLRGSLLSYEDICHTETLTRKIPGVKDVKNELTVLPAAHS